MQTYLDKLDDYLLMKIVREIKIGDMINVFHVTKRQNLKIEIDKYIKKSPATFRICCKCMRKLNQVMYAKLDEEFPEPKIMLHTDNYDSYSSGSDSDVKMARVRGCYRSKDIEYDLDTNIVFQNIFFEECHKRNISPYVKDYQWTDRIHNEFDLCLYSSDFIDKEPMMLQEIEEKLYDMCLAFYRNDIDICKVCGGTNHMKFRNGCVYNFERKRNLELKNKMKMKMNMMNRFRKVGQERKY